MKGIPSGKTIVEGRDITSVFEEDCDVVVIGSGSGGAVVSTHLAEAGQRVIVLEEGPYYPPEEYQRFRPSESVQKIWRDAGMAVAFGIGQTPMISLAMGRAVGGSSLATGGVCFRIPSDVHHTWVHELGLHELSERALESAYEDVERRISVSEVPADMRSKSTVKFVEGAERLGISMHSLKRNTGNDCEGNARCNFACPIGAKKSVDVSYLPSALAHGARVIADALVTNVIAEHGRAAGVRGSIRGANGKRIPFTIRARAVVSACGTIHTPLLLDASRVGRRSGMLGEKITLHPGVRCMALFDDEINGWDGAMQSVYSDHYHAEGIKLVGVYGPVNMLAGGLPGSGPKMRSMARKMSHIATMGAMVHDEGGGRVRAGLGREPIITYEMAPRDLARLRRSMTILSEIAFAGGAREVFLSVMGAPPIRSVDDARALERSSIDPRRIECMAFHPLGSARMSNDPRRGIVDQNGETYDLPGLYVADGSVLPTSVGVNTQVPVMSMATRIAWRLAERMQRGKSRGAQLTR